MKKTLILSTLIITIYACSTDNDFSTNNPSQKWELVKYWKNCSINLNEILLFSSKTESTNTWFECDGPKLDYKKIEY